MNAVHVGGGSGGERESSGSHEREMLWVRASCARQNDSMRPALPGVPMPCVPVPGLTGVGAVGALAGVAAAANVGGCEDADAEVDGCDRLLVAAGRSLSLRSPDAHTSTCLLVDALQTPVPLGAPHNSCITLELPLADVLFYSTHAHTLPTPCLPNSSPLSSFSHYSSSIPLGIHFHYWGSPH